VALDVVAVIGTRPEAIKMLPVVLALERSELLRPVVVSTGQHGDMVRDILAIGGVEPDVDLGVRSTGSLNHLVTDVMRTFGDWCVDTYGSAPQPVPADDLGNPGYGNPAGVLVHGDTSSALAAAQAAFHLRIPVGHIESGLRTGDTLSPFPEELNRQVIGRIAAFHLAPTELNEQNLVREGIDAARVFVTGNTGIDALMLARASERAVVDERLQRVLADEQRPLVVVTAHRRDNWGGGLERIAIGVHRMIDEHPDVNVVLVTHPNPAARSEISAPLADLDQVLILDALDYPTFASVMAAARFAISDSGGVQEEAPALGTPVLVTRRVTERIEGLHAGTVKLVGTTPSLIADAAHQLLRDDVEWNRMRAIPNPYGDGRAAERIVAALEYLAVAGQPEPRQFGAGFDREHVLRAGGYRGDSSNDIASRTSDILE
jgi:UDP-N-acetylglucosamine 2-epimerase (non-hydrolysing)